MNSNRKQNDAGGLRSMYQSVDRCPLARLSSGTNSTDIVGKSRLQSRQAMATMRNLLASLKGKDSGDFFSKAVDLDEPEAPGYHDLIKDPMDFGTLSQMLDSNEFMCSTVFDRLVRLVFTNALTYNKSPTHEVHQAARRLLDYYEQEWARLNKGSSMDVSIDLKDDGYLRMITEAAKRVKSNSSSLNDESNSVFGHLKKGLKSARGDWVKSVRNGKKARTNDEGAQKKIYNDIETYMKVKRKKSTSSKMKARARSNCQEQGDSGSEGAAKKEVFISLFNQPYREVIIEAAKRVCANDKSVEDVVNSVYSHLKSAIGGGVWTKRERSGVKVVTDDTEARRKIEKDIRDVIRRQGESLKEEPKKIPKSKKRKAAPMEHDQDDSAQKQKAASIKPSSFLGSQASSSNSLPSKQKKSTHAYVKQEEEDDESVEAIDFVDLINNGSEEESTNAAAVVAAPNPRPKAVHAALLPTAGKVVQAPCLRIAQQTPGRPPFFQLYERVMTNLSQAEEDGDINAKEFYSQLKKWFVLQTNDEGFSHSSFDHMALQNDIEYFESAIANVTTAKSQGNGANLAVYSAELKYLMRQCKIRYPVAQTGPIKSEYDQNDVQIKLEDDWC